MRMLRALAASLALAAGPAAAGEGAREALRVCADPDNLPYSHQDGSGFENRIARLLAQELGLPLQYAWLPDRRGFVRKTMGAGLCDLIVGVPVGFERALLTRPYYRSSYAWVQRADAGEPPRTLDDPRLAALRIGVQLIGDDLAASPPGHALARRRVAQVVGFPVPGEQPAPQRMVDAVARGELDGALIWGPQAGFFAARAGVPMRVQPVPAPGGAGQPPFEFAIAMGVRRGDDALHARIEQAIERRRAEIDRILADYAVPRVAGAAP